MDIKKLKKEELLKMRDEINSQLKYIDELKIEIKKSKEKNILSDLDKNDKIFCINFSGSKILNIDYVNINFYKQEKEDYKEWTNFSTNHDTKPLGFSSCVKDECMNNHFFLSEFTTSMYFLTLKPENWKNDLKSELKRLIKLKENHFNKDIENFKNNIKHLMNNNNINNVFNELPTTLKM